jgi:uncharacterized MnhB-related membrane protein
MDKGDFRLAEAIVGAMLVIALLAAGFVANAASAAPATGGTWSVCTAAH